MLAQHGRGHGVGHCGVGSQRAEGGKTGSVKPFTSETAQGRIIEMFHAILVNGKIEVIECSDSGLEDELARRGVVVVEFSAETMERFEADKRR